MKEKISKANKSIGLIKKLSPYLPRSSLLTIYKMFVRPHLDYGDIIYDRPDNDLFKKKIESIQYNAALAITGAIRGTSMDKIFSELGLEYLSDRRWMRRLVMFFKIENGMAPRYLCDIVPNSVNHRHQTRNQSSIRTFAPRTELYANSFYPFTTRAWDTLDPAIRNLPTISAFKNALSKFIRPSPSLVYGIHHFKGLKLITRLRLGLSHLREHKFRHNFRDTVNPLCPCNIEPETTSHFLLRCQFFSKHRKVLFDSLRNINHNLINTFNDLRLTELLLYGNVSYDNEKNNTILTAVINYILSSERFNESLI